MNNHKQEILERLKKKDERLYLCKKSLFLFVLYYFRHYITHKSPDFHKEMARNFDDLVKWDYRFLVLCWFRDSAKTSFAKIDFIRNIVYWMKEMMFYCCYDEKKSENALFDIWLELQTNKYILEDFWQLYFDDSWIKKSKKTWIGNFLTANNVRVQATSVKKAIRWEVFGGRRPDYFVIDDFENKETKNSWLKTKQVIDYFNEMIPWLSTNASAIFLCNKISDNWSVNHLYNTFYNNRDARIFEKSLIENGEITWKDKFVMTDKEMIEINSNNKTKVISVEGLKRSLDTEMPGMFAQEYLNEPLVEWERFFNIRKIDEAIKNVKEYKEDWLWKVWAEPYFRNEYRIALDVASWTGLDHTVIQVLDITNWEQVAEWVHDLTPPELVVNEIIQASENYNNSSVAPENNGVGLSIISLMKERWVGHLLTVETSFDKIRKVKVNKFWWSTNSKTKPKMLYDLKRDFENWEIQINSIELLREMRSFSNFDIEHRNFNVNDNVTRHFDRVMAFAIVNQLKNSYQWDFAVSSKKPKMIVKRAWPNIR